MAKYICSKHPIEKNTIQFRDNDCKWTEQYNSVYNGIHEIPIKKSDGMTEDEAADVAADVAVDGFIYGLDDSGIDIDIDSDILDGGNKTKNIYFLAMRICINEYIFQTPLSYYYIDTKDIPNKYEYDFKNYKII
jgi:hypothetical protein